MINVFKITRFQENYRLYRVLQSVAESYRVLQSVTECYRVLQSINQLHLLGPIFGLVFLNMNFQTRLHRPPFYGPDGGGVQRVGATREANRGRAGQVPKKININLRLAIML